MFVYGPYKDFGVTNVWIDVIESDEWPVILQRSPKHHKNSVSNEEREEASVLFPLALCLCQSACPLTLLSSTEEGMEKNVLMAKKKTTPLWVAS